MSPREHERWERLLVKATDGLLSPAEELELDEHLAVCPECRQELDDFCSIKEVTDAMTQRILADEDLEPTREHATRRLWQLASLALISCGLLLLLGLGAQHLFFDPQVPWLAKLAIGLLALGALGLSLPLVWTRLKARGRDPYEEIDQ